MDYLRQLRNDEKRCSYSLVGTLNDNNTLDTNNQPLFVVPKGSMVARIYAVVKVPFAVGSTVSVDIYSGTESGTSYFTNLALDSVVGEVTMGPGDSVGAYLSEQHVGAVFNQLAVDSTEGEAYIVVEFTEVPVTAGAYTR